MKVEIRDLHPKQYEIFKSIKETPASETKHHVLIASRGSGKTFLLIREIIDFISLKNRCKGLIVSGSFIQFNKLWNDLIEIAGGIIKEIKLGVHIIEFINGSTIQFYTAKSYLSIKGQHVDFLICDEVALYPKNSLDIITPVIDSNKNAKGIYVSTPMGKNDFYYLCMQGMNTKNSYVKYYRMSYLDNPDYDIRSVEEKRKTMPDGLFRSEFLAEFVFGTSSVFGEFKQYQLIEKWKDPIPGELYYAAVDWSGPGEDSTILTILNSKGEVVFIHECESGNIPEQVDDLAYHINKYNNAITKGEYNGLGIGGTDMLQLKCDNVSTFKMDNKKKNDLISRALKALFNKTLILPTAECYPKLDNEMTSYISTRTPTGLLTYRHEKGFHDDTVDSLLIANYTRECFIGGLDIGTFIEEEMLVNKTPTIKEIREYEEYGDEYYDDYY